MQLNKLIIEPRIRSASAAVDLGFVLGRLFWLRSVSLYMVLVIPVFVITHLIFEETSAVPFLIMWWLKPLFERSTLFMLSRELFSERMGFWNTLRNYKLWLFPGLIKILITRRISLGRSFYAPIILLEQPKGKDYTKRRHVISLNYASSANWLNIVLIHVESFLSFAAIILVTTLWPGLIDLSELFTDENLSGAIYFDLLAMLCIVFVAPFYTTAGFVLYISRRIELEGWDIEICFRDWVTDFKQRSSVIKRNQKEAIDV